MTLLSSDVSKKTDEQEILITIQKRGHMKNLTIAVISFLVFSITKAQSLVPMNPNTGELNYVAGGTACPQGTTTLIYHHESGRYVLSFDEFSLDGSRSNSSFGRTVCNIRIPINLEGNQDITIYDLDVNGWSATDTKDVLTLTHQIGFIGDKTRLYQKKLISEGDNFNLKDYSDKFPTPLKTTCSSARTSKMLHLQLGALLVKAKAQTTNSVLLVENMSFRIAIRRCSR